MPIASSPFPQAMARFNWTPHDAAWVVLTPTHSPSKCLIYFAFLTLIMPARCLAIYRRFDCFCETAPTTDNGACKQCQTVGPSGRECCALPVWPEVWGAGEPVYWSTFSVTKRRTKKTLSNWYFSILFHPPPRPHQQLHHPHKEYSSSWAVRSAAKAMARSTSPTRSSPRWRSWSRRGTRWPGRKRHAG